MDSDDGEGWDGNAPDHIIYADPDSDDEEGAERAKAGEATANAGGSRNDPCEAPPEDGAERAKAGAATAGAAPQQRAT